METKQFKRGDIIVSGRGNVGIYLQQISDDGFFYRLTAKGERAGTDANYAKQATEKEKKSFISEAKRNIEKFPFEMRKFFYKAIGEKKRVRPSLGDYTALQKEYEALRIELSSKVSAVEYERLKAANRTLEASNKYLENSFNSFVAQIEEKDARLEHLRADIQLLCDRNLFERIINRYAKESKDK